MHLKLKAESLIYALKNDDKCPQPDHIEVLPTWSLVHKHTKRGTWPVSSHLDLTCMWSVTSYITVFIYLIRYCIWIGQKIEWRGSACGQEFDWFFFLCTNLSVSCCPSKGCQSGLIHCINICPCRKNTYLPHMVDTWSSMITRMILPKARADRS